MPTHSETKHDKTESMSTTPLDTILYRELSIAADRELREVAAPLLRELVNYSTNLLARCATSTRGSIDVDLAPMALYRHVIEVTDGIEVLISQSCATPAIPLVRSSFEAVLSLEYILEEPTKYEQRSLSWLVGYIHKRIDSYERLDPATQKGKEFKKDFEADKFVSKVQLPSVDAARKAKTNLLAMLSKPHISYVEVEYNQYKGNVYWCRLFGGPSNIQQLAQQLKRGSQYDILYRQWSRLAHAQDLIPYMDRTTAGESAIKRLRQPGEIKEIASFSATFILDAINLMVKSYRRGEDIKDWYINSVRDRYLAITNNSIK